jgi:sentrin-specific protease 8
MSNDEIVLNWNDSVLYSSDLKLLNSNGWLNDRLIGFVYEYMEKETYKNEKHTIAFINPSTVQCLKLCSSLEEADMCFLTPLELGQKDFVFFPINNHQNSEVAGGCHWSFIFLDKKISVSFI